MPALDATHAPNNFHWRRWRRCIGSFANHLDDHPLRPLAIEFSIEDALPSPQIKLAGDDRQNHLMVHQDGFEVRIAVILAGLVMPVILEKGRQTFQPLVYIDDPP